MTQQMAFSEVQEWLAINGIKPELHKGQLKLKAKKGAIPGEIMAQIMRYKEPLIEAFSNKKTVASQLKFQDLEVSREDLCPTCNEPMVSAEKDDMVFLDCKRGHHSITHGNNWRPDPAVQYNQTVEPTQRTVWCQASGTVTATPDRLVSLLNQAGKEGAILMLSDASLKIGIWPRFTVSSTLLADLQQHGNEISGLLKAVGVSDNYCELCGSSVYFELSAQYGYYRRNCSACGSCRVFNYRRP